jgi:hypothetical protein
MTKKDNKVFHKLYSGNVWGILLLSSLFIIMFFSIVYHLGCVLPFSWAWSILALLYFIVGILLLLSKDSEVK